MKIQINKKFTLKTKTIKAYYMRKKVNIFITRNGKAF